MAKCFLSFGPDLEPLAEEARRGARLLEARRDGVTVSGTLDEVVARLTEAHSVNHGWCKLEQVLADDRRRPMYVWAAAVRYVIDEDDGG